MSIHFQRPFIAVIAALFLVCQTAWVKDKARRLTLRQLQRMDDFYLQLKRERRGISSVDSRDRLRVRYEKLNEECKDRLSQMRNQEAKENARAAAAASQLSSGQSEMHMVDKFSVTWANLYLQEQTAPLRTDTEKKIGRAISSIPRFLGASSKAKVRLSASESSVSVQNLNYVYKNTTGKSDLHLEFGEQVRSRLTYQLDDQVILWSLTTGF